MKRKIYLFLLFPLIIIYSCSDGPKINKEPIPERFKDYVSINQNSINFGKHQITLEFKSDERIELLLLENNELLVKTKTGKEMSQLSVLNTNGEILRNYSHKDNYENGTEKLIKGYLVNFDKNYYKTWAFDKDETEKKIVQQNEHLDYPNDKEEEAINDILSTAEFVGLDYDYDYKYIEQKKDPDTDPYDDKPKAIYFKPTVYIIKYLKQNKWYQFYTLIDVNKRISTDSLLANEFNSLLEKYDTKDREWQVIPNNNIQYQYFHRIERKKIIHPVGGGSPAYIANWWLGNLYVKVNVDNDTLKFYDRLYLDEEWPQSSIKVDGKQIGQLNDINEKQIKPFMLYENKNLNYSLFTNDIKKLFLIKRKNE